MEKLAVKITDILILSNNFFTISLSYNLLYTLYIRNKIHF